MPNESLEQELVAKGLTFPRVSQDSVNAAIRSEQYLQPEGTTLTICVLTLVNGFNVIGESACVDARNFNLDIGRRLARENAVAQIWKLEGYALATKRFDALAEAAAKKAAEEAAAATADSAAESTVLTSADVGELKL